VVLSALGSFLPLAALERAREAPTATPGPTTTSTTAAPAAAAAPDGAADPAAAAGGGGAAHEGHHTDALTAAPLAAAAEEVPVPLAVDPWETEIFRVFCSLSHRRPDDPIVYPGQPGAAHNHDFLGPSATDADVTLGQLTDTDTTCGQEGDHSAYWVPTLSYQGQPLRGGDADGLRAIYYKIYEDTVVAPPGLMILSSGAAGGLHWDCMLRDDAEVEHFSRPQSTFPFCPRWPFGSALREVVEFPDCWDGRHLDSADHRQHMKFSGGAACPTSHPVRVPQVIFSFRFPGGMEPEDLSLSSGAASTSHGDVIYNWRPNALQALIDETKALLAD
jgi:hypothetical protein